MPETVPKTVKELKVVITKNTKELETLKSGNLDKKALEFYKSLSEGMTDVDRKRNKLVDVEVEVNGHKIKVSEVLKAVTVLEPSNVSEKVKTLELEIEHAKNSIIEMV
jgi:hypothetical protein